MFEINPCNYIVYRDKSIEMKKVFVDEIFDIFLFPVIFRIMVKEQI